MIHHIAIASKNIREAHHFYTTVMGFQLAKAVKRKAPGGGWTKHIFYDMGDGQLFALWDLRGLEDGQIAPDAWRSGFSTGMGLPNWVNHIAFEASDLTDYEAKKKRWLDNGYHVSEVDHDFIKSCYTIDPDGTMVEWSLRTKALTQADRIEAEAIVADDTPAVEEDYAGVFIRAARPKNRASPTLVDL